MSWEGWYSIAVTTLCFGILAFTRYSPDIVLVGGLTLLLLAGVLSPEQALSGLANEGMVTVGVLYIVVAGLRETGGIGWIVYSVLGRPRSLQHAQIRLMAPVAVMSAFLNNTPVSYTHLRAHETIHAISYPVFCLKKFFFNDTATTEIYTLYSSSAASDVYKRQTLL